jgi:hypothetical protein
VNSALDVIVNGKCVPVFVPTHLCVDLGADNDQISNHLLRSKLSLNSVNEPPNEPTKTNVCQLYIDGDNHTSHDVATQAFDPDGQGSVGFEPLPTSTITVSVGNGQGWLMMDDRPAPATSISPSKVADTLPRMLETVNEVDESGDTGRRMR